METNSENNVTKVCRTCLEKIAHNSLYFYLESESDATITFQQKLLEFLPDINLYLTPNAVICDECSNIIDVTYRFKQRCLQTEEVIQSFVEKTECSEYVDLTQISQESNQILEQDELDFKFESIDIESKFIKEELNSSFHIVDDISDNIKEKEPEPLSQLELVDIQSVIFNSDVILIQDSEDKNENCTINNFSPNQQGKLSNNNYEDVPYKCYNCDYSTDNKLKLIDHVQTHIYKNKIKDVKITNSTQKSFKCNLCDYVTTHNFAFNYHKKAHAAFKHHKCAMCDYECIGQSNLKNHMKIHVNEKCRKDDEVSDSSSAYQTKIINNLSSGTEEKPYKCKLYDYYSSSKDTTDSHMLTHNNGKPFKCNKCLFSAASSAALRDHLRSHIKGESYKCDYCEYTATLKIKLNKHMALKHRQEKSYRCNECDFRTDLKMNIMRHMKCKHQQREKKYKCNACEFVTNLKKDLIKHERIKHADKIYKCNDCRFYTKFKENFMKHVGLKHQIKNCNDGKYETDLNINRHTEFQQSKEKPYKCNYCDYVTNLKVNLTKHMAFIHSHEKPYKCNQCDYGSIYIQNLNAHVLRNHTEDAPYKCIQCDYRSKKKHYVNAHFLSVHKNELYKCAQCEYSSTQVDNVNAHMLTFHDAKDKRYECTKCTYSTFYESHFKAHISKVHVEHKLTLKDNISKSHAKDVWFNCNLCGHRTKNESTLTIHMRVHTGEKPYKCTECEYSSAQSGQLTIHMRRHTGEKPYECSKCFYKATSKGALNIHYRSQHKRVNI